MDMSTHLSQSQILTDSMSLNKVNQKGMFHGSHSQPIETDCHTSHNCPHHACGGHGITSSTTAVKTVIPLYNFYFEYFTPNSTDLSPSFKPPISFL